ncbi:MAG TPA: ROK family protein, partial [Gaiellaceae bacterium]
RMRRERPTPTASQNELLEGLDEVVEELLDDGVGAIGFGIPSRIDQRSGRTLSSTNIPLEGVDFRDRMAERFGLPVGIDNDGNAATIAEWRFGAGRGVRHMVMLTLGTGVGGGLILDGRPYRGSIGAGAELGHMVIDYDGPHCQGTCRGHGHLEVLASGTAATAAANAVLGGHATARELVERAQQGDAAARNALAEIGRRLGAGLVTIVNVFDPELIVIGGGFAAGAGALVLEPARELALRESLTPTNELLRIVPAELGPEAGLVGAGLVAFEALDAAA